MILQLYKSKKDIYVKPDIVDAIIPVLDDNGYVIYTSIIIHGKEYKIDGNPDFIIHSIMKMK